MSTEWMMVTIVTIVTTLCVTVITIVTMHFKFERWLNRNR